METHEFGFLLGRALIGTRDEHLPSVCKIVGEVPGNISAEYLALLMWTATWMVSGMLGQYAEPVLNAMHSLLYDAEGGDKTKFETFLHDRYASYYAAIGITADKFFLADDKPREGEGMRLYYVAEYFLVCCRSSGGPVIYKRIIPALDELDDGIKRHGGRADVVPKLRAAIEEDIAEMTRVVSEVFAQIKNMPYEKALDEFASRVAALLQGTRLDLTDPIGHRNAGREMLHAMAATLLKLQNNPARFQEELMAAARAWAEPPTTYPTDLEKAMQITIYFAGFMNGVLSLVSNFVKEL